MYEFDTGGTGFLAFPYSATENSPGVYTNTYSSGNVLSANLSNTTVTFEVTDGGAPGIPASRYRPDLERVKSLASRQIH